MNNLENTFERVYCVTLKRRPDRWVRFTENIQTMNGDWPFNSVVKYDAIDGKKVKHPAWWSQGGGAWGCFRSHLNLLERCLNDGVKSVLLLEDDALFPEDFPAKVAEFMKEVPDDWGMLYLGGQHLMVNRKPPERVNDHVYVPFNVNRTHAFALRGKTMTAVYQHLCRKDWHKGNHIDHHLGRFHQRRDPKHRVYCPKEWLVGQAGGKSNISGRTPDDRFWKPAEHIASVDPKVLPFIAVLGLHSSGSSCVAGVLHHLGIHLGNKLVGYYGNDPEGKCGFEAVGLMKLCEKAIPFPHVKMVTKRQKTWAMLSQWLNEKRREAFKKGTIAGGKYPQLCRMGNQLINICGKNLRVIAVDRPIEESIESMVKRTKGHRDPNNVAAHQRWLDEGKEDIIKRLPDDRVYRVDYHTLVQDPETVITNLVKWLGIEVTDENIQRAITHVNPELLHVGKEVMS